MTKIAQFTDEQVEILNQNRFTHHANNNRISFTVEFKQFFMEQYNQGMKAEDILTKAGYRADWFNPTRIRSLRQHIREEAKSSEGFKQPKSASFAEKKAKREAAERIKNAENKTIAELQERVAHLEEQLDFLKKTAFIRNRYQKNVNGQ